MAIQEDFQSVLYDQRLAHKLWLARVGRQGIHPSEEADGLVWELLVAYGSALENGDETSEDIYKSALELAKLVLPELQIDRALDIYRDALLDAMMDSAGVHAKEQYRALVRFTNLISSAFTDVSADALKKTIRHNRAEILSNELRVAKRVQSHLLPKVIPVIPGFEFAGRLVPAQEIGGDYWSVKYYAEDGVVTLKLADITGHGIAAATLVAAVKFISGGYYRGSTSAAEVMRQTNRVLTKETPRDILVTMVYGWLRPETYDLTVVNAGHEPVFLCSKNRCTDVRPTGPILGVDEEAVYSEEKFKLSKNDIVFFGSDGITEAGIEEPFGLKRLKSVVRANAHLSANEIVDAVIRAVTDHVAKPHDDLSLLVVKVTGEPTENT